MEVYLLIIPVAIIFLISSRPPVCQKITKSRISFIAVGLVLLLMTGGCGGLGSRGDQEESQLEVHFIDVGQGDSILIKNGSKAMLIDSGTKHQHILLSQYLDQQGIKKLDYVIGTNPLRDHVGGLNEIIDSYQINRIYLPQVDGLFKTYKDIQVNLLSRKMKAIKPEPGKNYSLGEASFTMLAPSSSSYDDLADYSIVIKLIYGETSFVLTGDAGKISEQEMLDMNFDLSANVLKVGRHGSSSSCTDAFLSAVNPDSAIISVGKDNPYLHPHMATMLKLKENDIAVYRTDEQGSIVAVSDGKHITFNVEPGSYMWPEMIIAENESETSAEQSIDTEHLQKSVFLNENSNKYHAAGCSFLEEKCVEITQEQAIKAGYEPCLLCKP